jgi:hypothetical protein
LLIQDVRWEVKSPKGDSKNTIENNLKKASKQSTNIVIDFSRIKMHEQQAFSRLNFELSKAHHFKRVLAIKKTGEVVSIL